MTRGFEQRFWSKVEPSGFCWDWVAGRSAQGYGIYWSGTRYVLAHRHAYESMVDKIADGLQLDHLCRNRACVNPDHLEPVTNAENNRRKPDAVRSRTGNNTKTHCPKGHPYSGENLYERNGRRHCRACAHLRYLEKKNGVCRVD